MAHSGRQWLADQPLGLRPPDRAGVCDYLGISITWVVEWDRDLASGMTSGWRCGAVISGNLTARGFYNLLWYDMCLAPGDSGGPVIISQQAVALVKGAYDATNACNTNWGSYVKNAEAALSVRITRQ